MGRSKALLELDGLTFLARAVGALRAGGCDPVLVVASAAGTDGAEIAAAARGLGAGVVLNPLPDSEQIESLRCALRSLPPEVEGAVVTPVDHPRLHAEVVAVLLSTHRHTGAAVAVPVHAGRRGHPTLFARTLFAELLTNELAEGARSVIAAHAAEVQEVAVDHADIHWDVDTPEDFRRLQDGAG